VCAVVTAVLPGLPLVRFERWLHRDPYVRLVIAGDFNGMEVSRDGSQLYVIGARQRRLRAYALSDLSVPLESGAETGPNQSFGYNPDDQELYAYNRAAAKLLVLRDGSLELVRSVDLPQLPPGDIRIFWDKFTRSVGIASEANQIGLPAIAVVNPQNGQLVDSSTLEPGNLLMHPSQPLLYMSFFRRSRELIAYDTVARRVARSQRTDPRIEGMVFLPSRSELLLTSPVHGRVLRYDAATLQPKGHIDTVFGVRTLALDSQRELLLAGSFLTNKLEVIDMKTHRAVKRYHLGPWLRMIALDIPHGIAFVSSPLGIYELQYDKGASRSTAGIGQ
jgi:hypothetical protein